MVRLWLPLLVHLHLLLPLWKGSLAAALWGLVQLHPYLRPQATAFWQGKLRTWICTARQALLGGGGWTQHACQLQRPHLLRQHPY